MPIPEKQLATWANVRALMAATDTYNSVKAAIVGAKPLLGGHSKAASRGHLKTGQRSVAT